MTGIPPGVPSAELVLVTPQIAEQWLAKNLSNRNVRPAIVDAYARDMLAGRWEITGEAVKFSPDGVLLDGQHRAKAVLKWGVTVPMFVMRGISATAQEAMDSGAKRTAADALTLSGTTKQANIVAAAARIGISVDSPRGQRQQVTHAEVLDFVRANPDITRAAEVAGRLARKVDCPPALVAYTTWRLGQIDPDQAVAFWTDAAEKVGLNRGDPVLALTQRLAEAQRSREQLPREAYLSMIYRAWNARRTGRSMRMMKINSTSGGLIPAPDPK